MIGRLYAAAATLAAPVLRLWLWHRLRRGKELAPRLAERWGSEARARPPGGLLWLHAASVGEAVSVLPILPVLAAEAPGLGVLFTTGSVTSAEIVARRIGELGLSGSAWHRFVPLDVPAWAAAFLDHWRPDAACFVEQEIWPNLLAGLHRRGIPVLLLNARLSARSAARWGRAGGFARGLFGGFAAILAQSEADARRLRALGGRDVTAPGNLKLAAPPLPAPAGDLEHLRTLLGTRPVWLAASTHPGEEAQILHVHAALAGRHPDLLTIVAPRHPARGAEIAALAIAAGCEATRRSERIPPPAHAGIWVADTIGELGLLYRLSPIVLMGGSLVAHGGQNPLEPARLGCAVAVGPHTGNFAEIVALLAAAEALVTVADADALLAWVRAMLDDPARRVAMAEAGLAAAGPRADLPLLAARAILSLLPS